MNYGNAINAQFTNIDAFGNLSSSQVSSQIQLQFPYNVNADEVTSATTGSGTVTHSVPFAVLSTTAAINSTASISSKNSLHYYVGQGGLCLFTAIFTTGAANSTQEIGIGDSVNALTFGYNGTTFSINRRTNSVDNYIAQSDWNVDTMNGSGPSKVTLVPNYGNVFKIQYKWLGFGAINFFIENPNNGSFLLVHQIKYANQFTTTTLLNPTIPLFAKVSNTSNNTNIVLKTSSMSTFVEGQVNNLGLLNSIQNSKGTITTEVNVLTIRNNATFGGITNRKQVIILFFSSDNAGVPDVVYKLKLNATLGGSPSYTNISTNTSVVSYDTAGTTVTGGRQLVSFYSQGNSSLNQLMKDLPIILNPGDILTVSATSSGAAITASVALTWSENF